MYVLYAILAATALSGLPKTVAAQASTDPRPVAIDGYVLVESVRRINGTEIAGLVRVDFHLTISGNRVQGGSSRNILSKDGGRVLASDSFQLPQGYTLGRVGEVKGDPGHGVVLLSGNTLTLLRTFKTGAFKATITLGRGSYCRVRYAMAQEVGKGNQQSKSVSGEDIQAVRIRQVDSSCRMTRV